MYSSAKFGRFKSNCMTEINGLVAPPSWVEGIYLIPLYGVLRGLNLNLNSVGGRCLKLTDYFRAEARRYLPDRAKAEAETMRRSWGWCSKIETVWGRGEAEPVKKLPRGRLKPRHMPWGLHPWLKPICIMTFNDSLWCFTLYACGQGAVFSPTIPEHTSLFENSINTAGLKCSAIR